MTFTNRTEVIEALVKEYNEKPGSFSNNEKTKSREKFWTFNRLHKYYWNLKLGRTETYRTEYNPLTGYHQLKTKQC
jgi:hypothetical protein